MPGLTTYVTFRGIDDLGPAVESIKGRINGLDKQLGSIGKSIANVEKVDKATGALASTLDRARQSVAQIEGASKSLRGEFERITAAQDKLGAYKTMQENTSKLRMAFNETQKGVRSLALEMSKAGEGAEKFQKEYATAQLAASRAADAFRNHSRAMAELGREIESVTGGPMRSIRSAEAQLASEVERASAALREQGVIATRTAEQVAAAARRQEEAAGRSARRRGAMATIGVGAGLILGREGERAASDVISTYREYDKERRYQAAVMRLTPDQQQPLIDQAIGGAASTKYNDIQYLEAQRSLGSRGLGVDTVLGIIGSAANLGMATDQDLPAAAKMVEANVFGFRRDMSTRQAAVASSARAADVMVKAMKISGMDPNDVTQLYKYGASSAAAAGIPEEDMLAFGGALKRANIGGDESGTAFRSMVKSLLDPTSGARTALLAHGVNISKYQHMPSHLALAPFYQDIEAKYGVKLNRGAVQALGRIFQNQDLIADPAKFTPAVVGALRGALGGRDAKSLKSIAGEANRYRSASQTGFDFMPFLGDLDRALKGNVQLADAIFGGKQGARILNALGHPELFNSLAGQLTNDAGGYAADVAQQRMGGFDGALSMLEGAIKNVATNIGRAWDDNGKGGVLTDVTAYAAKLTEGFAELDGTTIRVATAIGGLGAAAAGLVSSFLILRNLMGFGGGGARLIGAATALDGAAAALDAAAVRLGGGAPGLPGVRPGGKPGAPGLGWFRLGAFALNSLFELDGGDIGSKEWAARINASDAYLNALIEGAGRGLFGGDSSKPMASGGGWLRGAVDAQGALLQAGYQPGDLARESFRESARGDALSSLRAQGDLRDLKVSLDPNSKVQVDVSVKADEGGLLNLITRIVAKAFGSTSVGTAPVGASTAGVPPNGRR